MKLVKLISLVLLIAVLMSACNKVDLYQDLNEEDANEMLVLLSDNGIKANKKKEVKQNETFWSLSVNQKEISRARELLVRHNLPRRKELGLTGVYKEKGLIPTPDEQKARFLLAMKGEIINSLERLPEVIDADVVLNVPSPDEFADAETKARLKPTASVVIKAKYSPTNNISEEKIQQFVANTVEGMNPRDVAVLISYIDEGAKQAAASPSSQVPRVINLGPEEPAPAIEPQEEIMGLSVSPESKKKLKAYIMVFIILLLLLALALVIAIFKASRMRRESGQEVAGHIEGKIVSETPPALQSGKKK